MVSLNRITVKENMEYDVAAGPEQTFFGKKHGLGLTFAFGFSNFQETDISID